MRKVLNFVKGKREDKKDATLSLNVANISVEITDPAGVTTPSDDYDFVGTTQQCTDYEVDLSGKDKSITKLHKAAWVGNLEKVKSLLKKVEINVVDSSNRTPLHLAAAQGHTNVVWFLLSNKAAMDVTDVGGKSSFLKAVEGGYKEIVSNMLEKGTDINFKDADGNTALHIATKLGYYDIATVLLKNGANFESANKKGEYALHIATTAEHMDLVELLLRYGAAVNITDIDARTPLMLAARCGNAPLVELFLEYGAKREMIDNSSFTAQDYAINKGYSDLAALLVTATMERIEEEDKLDDTETDTSPQCLDKQHSISSGSLVPVNGSHVDVSDTPAEDGDSWNDSEESESNREAKIPRSKLKAFLSPSGDDQSEEESLTKEEKNVHDSPNSCVIPPPLKPPRSWDLIQAGMIDDNTGAEVKRCSLTALGTLRSRRESFNDSVKSDLESPMSMKDGVEAKDIEKGDLIASKTNSSSKIAETAILKRDKSDLSAVESDWDSDESLPLDKSATAGSAEVVLTSPKLNHRISVDIHQDPDDDLPAPPSPSQLFVSEDPALLQVINQSAPGSGAVSPEPVSEKRARMLLMQNQQSVELTLTDDKTEDKSDHSEGSPSALPRDGEGDNNAQGISPSVSGTLGRDGTMLGYEEMWESNAAYSPTSPTSVASDPLPPPSHSLPRIDEKVETSEGEQSPSSQIIIDLNVPKIIEISSRDIVKSPIGNSVCSIPPPVPLAISGKSEEIEDLTMRIQDSKPSTKRHVRNKSIFYLPLHGEVAQQESSASQLHLPSTQALHDQIINRQLECYDIAIRDLAASSPPKLSTISLETLNPITIHALKSSENVHSDSFVDKGHIIMPDILAGSKVAALAAAFGGDSSKESHQAKCSPNSEHGVEQTAPINNMESVQNNDAVESERMSVACGPGSIEKPIRKKRKSLLAMQKLEPTSSQGSQGSQSKEKSEIYASSSDSEEDPVYWESSMNKVVRQSTVINKANDVQDIDPLKNEFFQSLSLEDIQPTSTSGSSNEDVTAPVDDVEGSLKIQPSSSSGRDGKFTTDSDAESGASQTDNTPSHTYLKNHESLLKHHLQVVTEERGRLAETTVELGEKTERLMYELADAREAARARDEVISMLQIQLQRLEESQIKGLEEVQTHRFHLDSRDQELRHLEEVCRKAQEETIHLKEIIRLKDKEITNLTLVRANRDEEAQMHSIARNKEKDMIINELRIHLKYVEQERDRLKEMLVTMEHQQASLQARTEALVEENVRTSAQIAKDVRSAQEEASKWRGLYESCLLKLEAVDSTQVKVLLDAKNSESETAQAFHNEILSAVERLEKEKEADRHIWQAKIKEEVASAVHLLKSEYEKVEETLRKHNSTLEAMVQKLQIDNEIAIKRQECSDNQLKAALEELQQNKGDSCELTQLQLEFSRVKHQVLTDQNKIKTLESELEVKEKSLTDLRKTLNIVRQEKKELTVCLTDLHERQEKLDMSEHFTSVCHKNAERIDVLKFQSSEENKKNKLTQEMENNFLQEKEELLNQISELKIKLQKRDNTCASLCNASAMTDQVRWNQTGLMGVVQKQKEEIEYLKLEYAKLKSSSKSLSPSPGKIPPDVKPRPGKPSPKSLKLSPDTLDLLKTANAENSDLRNNRTIEYLMPLLCQQCNSLVSPIQSPDSNQPRKNSTETQTIEGCESPAHTSKCSSPRHSWNQKTENNIQQELQAQAEKCLKHQQMIAGLKAELQLLRGGGGDHQFSLQKQVSDLQQKIKDEIALRSSLELQMNKMRYEVQEKGQVEKELEKLKGRLKKDFVSRSELDYLKMLPRADETSELSTKLAQVNKLSLQQAHERSSGQAKESLDAQIHKEYEETRQYLVSELAKVKASLLVKENEEKELKLKCEKLSREYDKKNEERRKILIEKSYNLGQQILMEKYDQKVPLSFSSNNPQTTLPNKQAAKESVTVMDNPYSKLLRKEVKKNAEKFKSTEPVPDLALGTKSEDRLVNLEKRYCLP